MVRVGVPFSFLFASRLRPVSQPGRRTTVREPCGTAVNGTLNVPCDRGTARRSTAGVTGQRRWSGDPNGIHRGTVWRTGSSRRAALGPYEPTRSNRLLRRSATQVYDSVADSVSVAEERPHLADREVYPNAPLRLVTAEFRFPLSPRLAAADLLSVLGDALGARLPIVEPIAPQGLQLAFGPEGAAPPLPQAGYRLLTRDRTTAVTVASTRVAVETTMYEHWEDFRDNVVALALKAIGDELAAIAGLDRVGLRYINEVRVPGAGEDVADWEPFVAPELLATARLAAGQRIRTMQLALHLDRGDGAELLMRSGLLEGHVVDDTGPLRLPTPPQDGHFFLIDMDSFWSRPAAYEEWRTASALEIADRLHEPIDDLFESCIQEKLRDEVLRRQP